MKLNRLEAAPDAWTVKAGGRNALLTMTSREIAALTGKEHFHVTRDIATMLFDLGEVVDGYLHKWIHPQNGQTYTEYRLDRELTETLLTGYSAVLRRKVIARWYELEAQVAAPVSAIPQTLAQALRLAADQADQIERQHAQLSIAAPKADALDRIADADGAMCITDAAKHLQLQPKRLFAWLSANDWIYRRPGNAHWIAYQPRLKSRMLDHKVATVARGDGTDKVVEQVLVTAKGLAKLALMVPGAGAAA